MKGTNVLTFIVGAAVGSVASYFIFKKKFQEDADNQIREMRNKISELKEHNEVLTGVKQKAEVNYNKSFEPIAKPGPETNEVDYAAISKKKVKMNNNKKDGIRSVDENEYYNLVSNGKYKEKLFTFYQGDNQLVDEETELAVDNPETYLGSDGVDAMKKVSVEETYYADDKSETVFVISVSEDRYDLEPSEDD